MHEWDDAVPEAEGPQPIITIPVSGILNWYQGRKQKEIEEFKRQEEIYRRIINDGKGDSDFQRD